jgi:glucoamylase
VLVHAILEGNEDFVKSLQLYVLLAPHLAIGGAGNTGYRADAAGKTILVACKGNTYLAMGADADFARSSVGYVGASDGWTDLSRNYRMDWTFDRADDGNIALTAQIDLSRKREFTVALAFGDTLSAAVSTLLQSLCVPFSRHLDRFISQWKRTPGHDELACNSFDGGRLYRVSRRIMLAHEDKRYAGALIASASIPWGQAHGDEDIGGYHLVWPRDLAQSASAMLASGDRVTPLRALVYLAGVQREDGGFSQNFWIDGRAHWRAIQLDQVAYAIMLAWRLWKEDALQEFEPYHMMVRAARYIIVHGPATQQERWEEHAGYSPSTLAAVIAGLVCAADYARNKGRAAVADFLLDAADFYESHVEYWTVAHKGELLPGVPRHYVHILPINCSDPSPDENVDAAMLRIAHQPPGRPDTHPARNVTDAGFLELVRYGVRRPDDPLIIDSLRVVDATLKVDTPRGPCWRRFNHDGYGEHADGTPYDGAGIGRAWPHLTGERGHYELAAGKDPTPYIEAIEAFATAGGLLSEQIWDSPDIPKKNLRLGEPTGSARPLMWAHAEYVKLLRSAGDKRVYDLIAPVAERYQDHHGRKDLEIWKFVRQVRRICRGSTLRVGCENAFRLRWTADQWRTASDTDSKDSGLALHYADIPVSMSQKGPVKFTFFWTTAQKWEGRDYAVEIT